MAESYHANGAASTPAHNNPADTPADAPGRGPITLSPFYHSAVNAVTQPNKFTATSNYFIDRWMPLLGGNGTLIVLALRRDGFLNRKTGECRDEIVIDRAALARAAGMSEDTLTREMGVDKKTGKPRNEWLHLFVQKRSRFKRDRRGQVRQEESAYWVAMDDPIHPDDWPLVEQAVRESEARLGKRSGPETQSAFSASGPETQTASPGPQTAVNAPQTAPPKTQTAAPLKSLDSSLLKKTSLTPVAPGDSLSLFPEKPTEQDKPKGEKSQEADAAPAWMRAFHALPEAERRGWTTRASAEASGHGVKPRDIAGIVKLARDLFRQDFEARQDVSKHAERAKGARDGESS